MTNDHQQSDTERNRFVHWNEPGLDDISYRFDEHGTFFNRMLDRLDDEPHPASPDEDPDFPLRKLKTQRRDDPTIALLDAWAVVADVLTFYQERIANEFYLRTADERFSLRKLAGMIGYRPDPGLAAEGHLAFTLDDSEQAPDQITIPEETAVKSVPEEEEMPQTFETLSDREARPYWNTIRPMRDRMQHLALSTEDSTLYEIDTDGTLQTEGTTKQESNLRFVGPPPITFARDKDDKIRVAKVNTVYLDGRQTNLKQGDYLLLVGEQSDFDPKVAVKKIDRISVLEHQNRTRVTITDPSSSSNQDRKEPSYGSPSNDENIRIDINSEAASQFKALRKLIDENNLISRGGLSTSILRQHDISPDEVRRSNLESFFDVGDVERGIYAFRQQVGMFGSNAPGYSGLAAAYESKENNPYKDSNSDLANWDTENITIWESYHVTDNPPVVKYPYYAVRYNSDVFLERIVDPIEQGSWIIFTDSNNAVDPHPFRVKNASKQGVTGFSLNATVTGLALLQANGQGLAFSPKTNDKKKTPGPIPKLNGTKLNFGFRSTTAHVESERLGLSQRPMSESLFAEKETAEGEDEAQKPVETLALDRLVLGMEDERPLIVSGTTASGVQRTEVVEIEQRTDVLGSHSIIDLRPPSGTEREQPLTHIYQRETVTIFGNVVEASHGETVEEILGSGDNSKNNQQFELSKPPLTYLLSPDAEEGGLQNTLTIRVNGIEWTEARSFRELGPGDRGYVIERKRDGTPVVVFGDGEQGARLPSGQENVKATYRTGVGLPGNVSDGQLTMLPSKPKGVKQVTNPNPTSGGGDPEHTDQIRSNAPLETELIEKRIVSLKDFARFATDQPNVAKATASLESVNRRPQVVVTVAGAGSDPEQAKLSGNLGTLANTMEKHSDGEHEVQVNAFREKRFGLKAEILHEDEFLFNDVRSRVEDMLTNTYSFENSSFNDVIRASEIIERIQNVDGVKATDISSFFTGEYKNGKLEEPPESDQNRSVIRAQEDQKDPSGSDPDARLPVATLLWLEPAGDGLELVQMN